MSTCLSFPSFREKRSSIFNVELGVIKPGAGCLQPLCSRNGVCHYLSTQKRQFASTDIKGTKRKGNSYLKGKRIKGNFQKDERQMLAKMWRKRLPRPLVGMDQFSHWREQCGGSAMAHPKEEKPACQGVNRMPIFMKLYSQEPDRESS